MLVVPNFDALSSNGWTQLQSNTSFESIVIGVVCRFVPTVFAHVSAESRVACNSLKNAFYSPQNSVGKRSGDITNENELSIIMPCQRATKTVLAGVQSAILRDAPRMANQSRSTIDQL